MSRPWTVPGPTRSDPGSSTGTATYNVYPPCVCGEAWVMHEPNRKGVRGRCSAAHGPKGTPSTCTRYQPAEVTP